MLPRDSMGGFPASLPFKTMDTWSEEFKREQELPAIVHLYVFLLLFCIFYPLASTQVVNFIISVPRYALVQSDYVFFLDICLYNSAFFYMLIKYHIRST